MCVCVYACGDNRYAAAALESLPPTYNAATSPVFDLFIDTFGGSLVFSA